MKKDIQEVSEFDLTDYDEFDRHCYMIEQIGSAYMEREFSEFVVDEYNRDVIRFLVYYFNNCKLAENIFPGKDYKVHKNLMILGVPGTGKTLLMQVFSEYLKLTNNPNMFFNLSVTQMMNYYKINGHIDRYTYNEEGGKGIDGMPFNICINDIGLETENQKSYGTSLESHFKKYHITSNLDLDEFKERFGYRLIDRFKSFNVIPLLGGSRRK